MLQLTNESNACRPSRCPLPSPGGISVQGQRDESGHCATTAQLLLVGGKKGDKRGPKKKKPSHEKKKKKKK